MDAISPTELEPEPASLPEDLPIIPASNEVPIAPLPVSTPEPQPDPAPAPVVEVSEPLEVASEEASEPELESMAPAKEVQEALDEHEPLLVPEPALDPDGDGDEDGQAGRDSAARRGPQYGDVKAKLSRNLARWAVHEIHLKE